ncbi:MAG: RHS repeat-associated core domain-containing protein [Terracidiphilus sp.]
MSWLQTPVSLVDGNAEECLCFKETCAVVDMPLLSKRDTWTTPTICNYDEDQMPLRQLPGMLLTQPSIAPAATSRSNSDTSDCGYDAKSAFTTVHVAFAFGTVSSRPSFYRGEQYDSDLGLYYLRARYYNAGTDRFMSRDSEDGVPSDPKTLRKYDYAGGDPVNVMDPSGRSSLVEYSLPTNIVSLGPTKMQRQYDNYTHQYVTTVAPQTILSLDNLACSIKALYAQGSYAAQGISSEADFVGCTAVPEQFAELCVRRFYPGFPVPALHCYVRFNGNKNDTLSFDSQGVHPDPAPSWWPQQYCRRINGGPNND